MHINDFDFELPKSLIAKYPLSDRSASRLLCVNIVTGSLEHKNFKDIKALLNPGDLLVFNDTKVIPARMYGFKESGGQVEVMIERIIGEREAKAYIKASKAPKEGSQIIISRKGKLSRGVGTLGLADAERKETSDQVVIEVIGRESGLFLIKIVSETNFPCLLEQCGSIPLPPYIDRAIEDLDKARYQTVYNKVPGAVAAPTAGLHFDQLLMGELKDAGIEFAFVTLHVGAGTFQPVRVENVVNHKMHKEYLEVSEDCCKQINATKARGNKVVAVGTTAVRALETAACQESMELEDTVTPSRIFPYQGDTEIFIYPGYQFHIVDALITNFHLPKSTLLMLISAFGGRENILRAYQAAVEEKYRFFSYGDAMILHASQ